MIRQFYCSFPLDGIHHEADCETEAVMMMTTMMIRSSPWLDIRSTLGFLESLTQRPPPGTEDHSVQKRHFTLTNNSHAALMRRAATL